MVDKTAFFVPSHHYKNTIVSQNSDLRKIESYTGINKNQKTQFPSNLTLHVSTEMEQNPTQDAGNLLQGKKKTGKYYQMIYNFYLTLS